MKTCCTALAGGLLVALAACQPGPLTDADRSAINALDQEFARLARAHALDTLVNNYYTEDAIVLAPNAPAATGRAAILALLSTYPPFSDFQLRTEEINGAGTTGWVRGRYSMVMAPPGAAAIPDSGKYLEIWHKQADGTWKVIRDMFNSDVPLPLPDTTTKKKS